MTWNKIERGINATTVTKKHPKNGVKCSQPLMEDTFWKKKSCCSLNLKIKYKVKNIWVSWMSIKSNFNHKYISFKYKISHCQYMDYSFVFYPQVNLKHLIQGYFWTTEIYFFCSVSLSVKTLGIDFYCIVK